ncbi:MAG: hypothetical protein ACRDS0_03645 [Pseudonocardiaceae bacterium]
MAERMSLHGSATTGAEGGALVVGVSHATAVWAELEGLHGVPPPGLKMLGGLAQLAPPRRATGALLAGAGRRA